MPTTVRFCTTLLHIRQNDSLVPYSILGSRRANFAACSQLAYLLPQYALPSPRVKLVEHDGVEKLSKTCHPEQSEGSPL
jgi:hypothetical protein